MLGSTDATHARFPHLGTSLLAFFGALFLFQPGMRGQTFKPESYQANSKTGGIQEAIDAAAKAGGGTVQIPAGTFILHAVPGHPAILLRSRVTLAGAGQEKTILKLEPNAKAYPAVLANENYGNPDAAEADHDITLQGFTIDVAASDQVVRETKLARAILVAGEQEVAMQSTDGVGLGSVLRLDPGPNEEIVPILQGGFKAPLLRPHPEGAKVVVLVSRLHGVALIGAHSVTLQDLTIQYASMDGIYLSNTVDPAQHHTYCQKINIQKSKFIGCHRNGISVVDGDDVTIANNEFREMVGGSAVDIEPNHPEQHGSRIAVRDNLAYRCYNGMGLSLQFSGPTSENFRGDTITGNKIVGMLFGPGVGVLLQRAGATVSGNTIEDPATEGVLVYGASQMQVTNNVITNPGHCHTSGNCGRLASGVGIRLKDTEHGSAGILTENTVTGNTIKDTQQVPTLLYGIDFISTGKGNTIRGNVASRFDPVRGEVVHVSGKAESNKISGNSKQ